MSTGRKRSLPGPACSSPAKRKKYLCKYQKAWEAEFSWLSHSDRSVNDAYCILCKSHLYIGSGAKNDMTRHAKSQNHMQLEMVQCQWKSKSMSLFVTMLNNSLKSKTTSAETQFCNFIAEHNIPFAVAYHFTQLCKKMFTDSEMHCQRIFLWEN
jgi:hypothetical protein